MVAIPERIDGTVARIYRTYEERNAVQKPRGYLGASSLGDECARRLWYRFHWAMTESFEGRILRLFDTGQREESRLVADLAAIGVTVSATDPEGGQWAVQFAKGHGGGHLDGAGLGFAEAPSKWHVLEFKTHNDRSFKDLVANGVRKSKPMHYAQMQVYMGLTGMERAAYLAVNKNDDTIYFERIHFDREEFDRLMARAERIVFDSEPPPRIASSAADWRCRMCPFVKLCQGEGSAQVNCRTCAHATAVEDGKWTCEHPVVPIRSLDMKLQRTGCERHLFNPHMFVAWAEVVDMDETSISVRYRMKRTGVEFRNGQAPECFSSVEISACDDKAALNPNDGLLADMRHSMGARLCARGDDPGVVPDMTKWTTYAPGGPR